MQAADRETPDRPTDRGADVRGDANTRDSRVPASALPTEGSRATRPRRMPHRRRPPYIACVPAMSVIALTTSSRLNQNVIQR